MDIAALRDELTHACQENERLQVVNTTLVVALKEAEEYFDQRADAEYLPGQAAPQGNEEMRLLCEVRTALAQTKEQG